MVEVIEGPAFISWMAQLADAQARERIVVRLRRLSLGNPGDVRALGAGLFELRIDYGPGYRVYYVRRGNQLLLVLGGGTKQTQARDIMQARHRAEST